MLARKTKKTTRRASKSPVRRHSSPRIPPNVESALQEFAYSDPSDVSSRTILKNVVFDRHDREMLSPQATQLFNSEIIFNDATERAWLLANVRSTTISINVDNVPYQINANYVLSDNRPFILILHGFGEGSYWTNWIKLAQPLSLQGLYSVIFVDLPGFGHSSGRDLQQASWKRHGPEIIVAILSSFHIRAPVGVVAQCGGAATTARTISRYPQWFSERGLVFSNSVIGDFYEAKDGNFEANLIRFNIYIVVYWIADRDHPKHCVAYKRWNKLRQSGFRHLQLIDLDPATQTEKRFYPLVRISNIGRCTAKNKAYVYRLSDDFVRQILDILARK